MKIYFPMTCNILTVGHISCLYYLSGLGNVTIGLLTTKALKGYKKEIVPFKDRKCILDVITNSIGNIEIVSQSDLNPYKNIKRYNCEAIASGDGWEKGELKTIERLKLKKIDIKFKGEEKSKRYSSSKILNQKN